MGIFESIFLGMVQGLTEFLPISSSGHLVIASKVLGIRSDIPFDIALHFATILAVCVFFFPDIIRVIKAFFTKWDLGNEDLRLGIMLIVASVPTAIIGFTFKDTFESMFNSLLAVGTALLITGALIMLAERYGKAKKDMKHVTFIDSFIIGIAQGCAIAPGLSRSGATISASLLTGLKRPLAARFSFLLSIPAVLGASIFKSKAILNHIDAGMVAGFISAAVFGYIAIYLFLRQIEKRDIKAFAYYCFAMGAFVIFLSLR